ncbi:glucoside xylosyltransferase 2-like isoform X1 [Limulus polyphemus]|uniref:UDP-D-xylose:beta-D-glucoside alpha-1,3-D-xylosyltransferase n=2 Tax=Limulus polyphemus TaxID=6850 RepID=A0ABM1RWK6_LIMPO|nr:glucoside xylosyltransferase 2-like isoform X1 [Limulus polyphemus]
MHRLEVEHGLGLVLLGFLYVFLHVHLDPKFEPRSSIIIRKMSPVNTTSSKTEQAFSRDMLKHIRPLARNSVVLATSVCGNRVKEALVMLKSAIALSRQKLHLVLMTEDEIIPKLRDPMLGWPPTFMNRVSVEFHPISYPDYVNQTEWRGLYRLCSTHKLFIADILRHIDAVILLDTDVLFLRPPEEFWEHFSRMNKRQMMGLTVETELPGQGWYPRHVRGFPIYRDQGVNGGVWLMNLTKLRSSLWSGRIVKIYQFFKGHIKFGDQDIVSIYFHYYPDDLYLYPCEWNFRTNQCNRLERCSSVERKGVSVLHGIAGAFHKRGQKNKIAYMPIYRTMDEFTLGSSLRSGLLDPMKFWLRRLPSTVWCSQVQDILILGLERFINETET